MKTNWETMSFFLLLLGMSSYAVSSNKPVVDNWQDEESGLSRSLRTRFFQWGKAISALTTDEDSWFDAQQFGWAPKYGKKSGGYHGKKGSGHHHGDEAPARPTAMSSRKPIVSHPSGPSKPAPMPPGPSKPSPASPTPAPTMRPAPAPPSPAPTMMPAEVPTSCPANPFQATSPVFGEQDPARYNIWLDLDLNSAFELSFYQNARTIWERIITGDTGDPLDVTLPPRLTGPAGVPNPVDDIYISGIDVCIDGPGNVLGVAGPGELRTINLLPVSGFMRFDTDDIELLGASLEEIILHEMAHVLGIGTLWYDLLSDDRRQYEGANALRVWQITWGCPGNPLIEDDGDDRTAGAHWEEDTLDTELMTGVRNSNVNNNPLSELSIAVLQDLGYMVDYTPAEPFCPPPANGCTCAGSILTEVEEKPPLSLQGFAAAQAYGFSVLQEAAESCAAVDCNVGLQSEGSTFVGDKVVVVLYQENEYIYEVVVTARG